MTTKRRHTGLLGRSLAIALALQGGTASATVTMVGTRVIYDASSQGQSLQFNNREGGANVVQLWVDTGDEHSTPETANAPFVVTPPIFRIEPGGAQTVRLLFTGKDLPQDRESVFYLNSLQIPGLKPDYSSQNQMLVIVRNRLKIFYRPPGIEGNPHQAAERLSLRLSGQGKDRHVAVSNTSGYFVSIANGSLVCGSITATLRPVMVAPRSEAALIVKGKCPLDATSIRATVRYIDDYGAVRAAEFPVTAQGTQ
jgi:fimbrial chaperone protein